MAGRAVLRHGATAGLLGATAVAAWFFFVDAVRGQPLFVPAGLGHALLHLFGLAGTEGKLVHVAAYTLFHYAAFVGVGIAAATIAERARRNASILAGAFLLFVVLEVGFYGLVAIISASSVIGAAAFYQVAVGNVIAAALMSGYLLKAYPYLWTHLQAALGGRG